jgi:hypothetical protein
MDKSGRETECLSKILTKIPRAISLPSRHLRFWMIRAFTVTIQFLSVMEDVYANYA